MKRIIALVLLTAACSTAGTAALAGNGSTKVRELSGYSDNDEGFRVVEVTTPTGPVTCVVAKDKYGGGFESNPKGVSVSLSCDWSPK